MDNRKLKIIIWSNLMLGLLIILSFINAIVSKTRNRIWFMIIIGVNILCFVFAIVLLIIFNIFLFRRLIQVEKLSKRKIINFLIFILCLILVFLFSFFAYLIRRYESKYLLMTTLLIFLSYICDIIIVGSIFTIFTVSINSCYTCYKCTEELLDENRRSDNLGTIRYRVWEQLCKRYLSFIINSFLFFNSKNSLIILMIEKINLKRCDKIYAISLCEKLINKNLFSLNS
jgi:hypothetical protein